MTPTRRHREPGGPYRFAIVGGGLTGTSLLCQLVDKLERFGDAGRRIARTLSITVFEKSDRFGPGMPHSDHYVLPYHITNMCAAEMSVNCERPGDFQDWVEKNRREPIETESGSAGAFAAGDAQPVLCRHYPRALMGDYLAHQFDAAAETARGLGINVELRGNSEVVDLAEKDGTFSLTIQARCEKRTTHLTADGVLLATGHWFGPEQGENYFPSPWPAQRLLDGIPKGETVGVIGSSLSAVEVALTLSSDGRFSRQDSGDLAYRPSRSPRRIVLHSRNGLLPRVRGQTGQRSNRYLTCERIQRMIEARPGKLELAAVFELLEKELAMAYGSRVDWHQVIDPAGGATKRLRDDIQAARRGDGPEGELVWQTLLRQIFPVVRELYLNLALSERQRFDRDFNTLFFMHGATQPVINAEKVLALIEAGVLSVVRLGADYRFSRNDKSGGYEFSYTTTGGKTQTDVFPYVVNARGQPRSVETDAAPLTQNLLGRGYVCLEETTPSGPNGPSRYRTGSIVVDPETLLVVRPGARESSSAHPDLFAVGAMTRGQMIDASMAYGISRSTAVIADGLIERLHHRI